MHAFLDTPHTHAVERGLAHRRASNAVALSAVNRDGKEQPIREYARASSRSPFDASWRDTVVPAARALTLPVLFLGRSDIGHRTVKTW